MGHSSKAGNILLCLSALEAVVDEMGADIHTGTAIAAAQAVLSK